VIQVYSLINRFNYRIEWISVNCKKVQHYLERKPKKVTKKTEEPMREHEPATKWRKYVTLTLLIVFLSHQAIVPLRHWTFDGDGTLKLTFL
jgi:hypothetical protein